MFVSGKIRLPCWMGIGAAPRSKRAPGAPLCLQGFEEDAQGWVKAIELEVGHGCVVCRPTQSVDVLAKGGGELLWPGTRRQAMQPGQA